MFIWAVDSSVEGFIYYFSSEILPLGFSSHVSFYSALGYVLILVTRLNFLII